MKIDLNKDFEEAFPNEAYAGFTMKQCVVAAAGFLCAAAVAVLVWHFTGAGIVECSYIGIPVMIPVCAAGFYAYQGQTPAQMLSEMRHMKDTGHLVYVSQEMDGRKERVFTMQRDVPGKRRRRKKHGSYQRK